jgi:hypothetical protein
VLYDRQGDFKHADAEYKKAVEARPKDADLLNDLAYHYYQCGDWVLAEASLRKALAVNPKHERAWINLGMALAQQGKVEEAFKAFTKVISPAEAKSNLGMILAQNGKKGAANQAFRESLEMEPDAPATRAALAQLEKEKPPSDATLPAPAPASASPAVKPGVPKPLAGDPALVHAACPVSNSHPAPLVAPVPIVVEPPSRTEASTAAAPGDLPTPHPTGDPGPGSGPVAGGGGKGSVKPAGDLESHDRPRSASPAEPAATDNSEELARQGWVPIRHSGGEAVRDVQREVPGLEDDAALGTATGTTDPNAHADK